MRSKTQAVLAAALLGLGAATGVAAAARGRAAPAPGVPLVRVAYPVPAQSRIEATELAVIHVPSTVLPEGAVQDPKAAIGHYAAVTLVPGQDLLQVDLAQTPRRGGLPAGSVGYTVPVLAATEVAGVKPGDTVAILAPAPQAAQNVPPTPATLLVEASVIALYDSAGQPVGGAPQPGVHLAPTPSGPAAVRLAVTLAQAELLAAYTGKPLAIVPDPWRVAAGATSPTVGARSPSGQTLEPAGPTPSRKAGETP